MKILIIGGVAAGTSAGAKARRLNPNAEIILFEKGKHISYGGCGMPYHLSGRIKNRRLLIVNTPTSFKTKYNIDTFTEHEVIEIIPDAKQIKVKNLTNGEISSHSYDKLIVSTGASPIIPPFNGVDLTNIFTLRSISDMDAIVNQLQSGSVKKACVIGGGLIGLETAENLSELGIEITVIEKMDQILGLLDTEMAKIVQKHLQAKDIKIILSDGVKSFTGDENGVKTVRTENGNEIETDMVIMSIGVKPATDLAVNAGVELGETGAIKVNEYMETNIPDIYSGGDCVEITNLITGKGAYYPLGSHANKHGKIIAENIMGIKTTFKGAIGSTIAKVFDLTVAKTGLSEKEAIASDIDYFVSHIKTSNHAGYYPGAEKMTIKLIANKSTKQIIGSQVIGKEGTDKRIDVIATAIFNKMTIYDLFDLDLAYAPPFSSAKDAVIVAGSVAEKVAEIDVPTIAPQQLREMLKNQPDIQIIDIRSKEDYEKKAIEKALNIPLDELDAKAGGLPKDKTTILYDTAGKQVFGAVKILLEKGFKDVKGLQAGFIMF